MMVTMPKIEKLLIMTANQKAVISEHTPDELEACQLALQKTNNILQYVFEKVEDDE